MAGAQIKVVKAFTGAQSTCPARQAANGAIVEKLNLPALSGADPKESRLSDVQDRLRKLEVESAAAADASRAAASAACRATTGCSVIRATISLEPVSGSGEPEIFRISVPVNQTVCGIWVEASTGPLGGFLHQIITSDAGSAVVAFTNLLTETKEVRVCLGIYPSN